jgi:site-specific recombinase XerD
MTLLLAHQPDSESTPALPQSEADTPELSTGTSSLSDAAIPLNSSNAINSSNADDARQFQDQAQNDKPQDKQPPEPEALNLPVSLAAYGEQARDYARQAKSKNTRRAYASDWDDFAHWCQPYGFVPLPARPETVALYLAALADALKPSTLGRRLATISQVHQAAGHETPTTAAPVRLVWAGIRRAKGIEQQGKAPAITAEIGRMVDTLDDRLIGTRDRALLLIGFAGAFRRSELVGLDVRDVHSGHDGLTIHIRKSKTDQEGQGRKVGIPYGSHPHTCPVRAYLAWLEKSGLAEGPLFRSVNRHGQLQPARLSDRAVALIVKRAAEKAGLNPDKYAGHSLRAGLATSAAQAGVSERSIMAQTGHKSVMVARRYIRDGSLFRDNAAAQVGL